MKERWSVFDRVIERLEELADMKIHFPLCGLGRLVFENSRRGRMKCWQEPDQRYGVPKALIWILSATSSLGAEMSTQSSPAKMSRAWDRCLFFILIIK